MKATYIKVGGIWRQVVNVWEKDNGSWQNGVIPFRNISGTWKQCIETPAASDFIVDSGGFTVGGASCDFSNGTVSFNSAICDYDIAGLTVQVRVIHYISGTVATVNYYSGSYSAYTDLGYMSNVVFGPPIPGKGYTVRLEINESA